MIFTFLCFSKFSSFSFVSIGALWQFSCRGQLWWRKRKLLYCILFITLYNYYIICKILYYLLFFILSRETVPNSTVVLLGYKTFHFFLQWPSLQLTAHVMIPNNVGKIQENCQILCDLDLTADVIRPQRKHKNSRITKFHSMLDRVAPLSGRSVTFASCFSQFAGG